MVSEENQPKKQRNEECFINCLPGDLIEQIFLRLPVSTLLRCIDVCKQWHKIIRDPQFVASHLQHAPHCVLVFFPQESVSGEPYPADAIVIDGAWSHSKYAVPVIGPDDFLCGSCNGLLCLYTKTSTIKIANLATGEHLHLEKPVKSSRGDHFLFYSFGCHPSTKEYKIIHFLADHVEGRYRPHDDNKFSVIQVYTLGDEKWRDIRTPEALSLNCVKNSGAINVDGIMYWLTEDMVASWQHAVMTFDLNEESFARIELPAVAPEDCASGGPRRYWIREIDGKISIATAQTYPSQPRRLVGDLQIWTLDNKAEQRWSQKYNIQYPPDYIPGPNLGHGDKIILPSFGCSLYSYELLGENFRTKLGKMAKLLDFSPHKPGNMKSYIFVKSLVRLDVYKNAGIVRRPKQRQGWELKKWETWEQELSKNEKSWSVVHKGEHDGNASARRNSIAINGLLPHIVDDEVRKEIGIKINQIFPNFPDQQPRSLRRLNCVAQRQDMENLLARMKNWNSITKATRQVMDTIISMMRSALEDQQVGASSSNAGISQNHGEGDDTKT
ncbi:F-box protein At3g07870-like isoform X1 [Lolium rigidum]|uniref:F-box protein At3g07870-like isoform X1 n=1 Tax=Lolium rigidum TaxID=89674 RepID=UPI001F5DA982|nr:F-box protein At3g07870-like isoform X1 [Lolium rigidum]XP_047048148.1 F-box protein At3g07870-like isoform X1 [Lolium rigidum]